MGAYLALWRCTRRYPAQRAAHSPEMLTRNGDAANRDGPPSPASCSVDDRVTRRRYPRPRSMARPPPLC